MMSKLIILVCSLLGLFSACVGQYVQLGQCDTNVPLVENFNIDQFLGDWYEVSRIDNTNQNGGCSRYQFTRSSNTINVGYSSVVENFLQQATGTVSQVTNTARLTLSISSLQNPIDFWIRDTDYELFAIAFSCENISNLQRRLNIWVLGRTPQLTQISLARIETTIRNTFNIDPAVLSQVDHSDDSCYTLPILQPGQPIIIPGQCNPNLPVLQNFNVQRFLGTWHQILSYQNRNSDGTCVRAEYSQGTGVVNVLNSRVTDRTLATVAGYATVTSNDNSARLSVVLNAGGTSRTQDLWVLASDYDNYAISYSCVNVSSTERQIFSFILSRTRRLPEASQAAVDAVVNSYLELNYRYYTETDQSDAGCFFFPDPVPNQPVVFRGQCESLDVQAMPSFDPARYMGLWHTIELYPSSTQTGTCSNAYYELVGGTVDVLNSNVVNERLATVNAVAVPSSTDGSAQLIVTFPIPGSSETVSSDYWVLDTDYNNYALVYSCSNINADEMRVTSWKLSRTKQLSQASALAINNVMNNVLVLSQNYFQTMDQSTAGCFYYPDAQPGVPVVFPGQCDQNVAVVQNFNSAQFVGTWYEIQAYPSAEQTGQCINHQLTSSSGTQLNLVTSSVTDQFLGSISSSIQSTANDNSGRLTLTTVSASGAATTVPFWILGTNYNDYALAYSCVNINSDFRRVWSWKLSRTTQLSAAANTAINNIITNNVVLSNDYYENVDQSERACTYLPDLAPGEIITLPGQCDNTITGVPNFNLARYAGRWRLIESYGSTFQSGTCNVADYIQETTLSFTVTNSQVANQALASISGTATIISNDGSGRLRFTFPGVAQPYDMMILDTDYDSYALAYGCENVNTQTRRITSWKLSRSNSLSQVAINNMNQIINNIEVLNNRYYYVVDRTDTGCFYYPPVDTTTGVRFRGQCNQNIPVVPNFQAARYLGLWHDIQSYPNEFQSGTCNNQAFSTVGNDIGVQNTQVVNQQLTSISGIAVPATADGSGHFNVTFNVGGQDAITNYIVMATDYDTYSFVYSCRPIDDEYIQVTSWKLSRTKTLTPAAVTAINNVMNNIPVLDQRYFITRDQTPDGCFYFPPAQPGVPVVFPGQCDNNIPVVPNFSMAQFNGLWHEIQAYPNENQFGQCRNHQFTVNGVNTLDLQSSNVLGLARDVTNGSVTFSSTDGSARLTVTIPLGNNQERTIPLWIVNTDYNNYALAYSCVNLNNDYRGVWSWKLSRTQQLSAASNTAINNAISNINVLGNEYFENIDQSDQACFHLPDLTPGEAVVLPGQCDTTIRGVPNFNLARYAGRWRLIESYGSNFQVGTCNVARYTLESATTLAVQNAQVVDQELATITGTATIASTDGSGVLSFYYPSRNEYFEFTILDTDYDSYALGYGCVNLNNNQRRVYSWKLSRDNTLSQTAINNINQIVNSIEVLHNPYYYVVDRTDTSCFYYPPVDATTGVRFRGQCNQNIPAVVNFQAERYLGLWHDIQSYPNEFQSGTCNNQAFSIVGNDIGVQNTQVVNQELTSISGIAVPANTDGYGHFNVTFNVGGQNAVTNYIVMATDYDTYSFVYSCRPIDDEYIQVTSWKLSRTKALTPAAVTAINNVMNNIPVLDQRYFITRDQTPDGCFYFPPAQPGVPVVFPGQCDDNIPVVPNFSMAQFEGLWHEIQAYPNENQPGQCRNHRFTVNGVNTLDLQSSNVLGLARDVTNGSVTFSSTDGSARLTVTIPLGNNQERTIPLWIVNTDYNNYALAYSCVNLNSDYREVWSWKLSRTQQLSAASNTAINNAISNINVLDNAYYQNIDQTDSACFYLPELGPTDPVVFPGQCDANIPVIQNFDANRYLGRWRLIESYYTSFQEGTCNAATYSLANNGSIIVSNTKVQDQQLTTSTGSAVPASNDGSGKLLVTLPGSDTASDYWILDTDYDNYALLYSCLNLPNNERRVWSWKMSRTATLPATATTAINTIVNSIDVLDARYYQTVDRSDAACFYYPTPDSNTYTVFPGQCDENIPAVPNFNANAYLGTWYDVESYPTNFQSGNCNTATYSPGSEGTILVQNTQVVNQELQSTSGTAVAASTDGSAKLRVTFSLSSGEVSTDYWVLATDYNTYSLVYSCRNIDDEFRAVYSWKLGRQRTLPPAAATAINTAINTVQVLEPQYYVQRQHTEEACFYYPDNQGGDVILNGQCVPNAQVPAVTNFNPTSFAGTWHEVARFPSAIQNGECIATQYSLAGSNTFNLVQTSVVSESLVTTTTQAGLGTDGRGVISININGVPFDNVYILATDYSGYALAYSCRNIDGNTKQVYSWKLSRSQAGLSNQANAAIDQIVSGNVDLFEGYYRYTGQDYSSCFYYPVFDQLPPTIELPGPCNSTIRGVPNFNAAAYLGRWFDVARYPQTAQNGQCNRAVYSDLGGGVVSVVNSQVVDETLASISGEARIASTDGSGQLSVVFQVGAETRTSDYYILATDYNSYALVYTCVNLPNGNRQVGSWKLSRTQTLTAQASSAIDAVVSVTQGLRENYYQSTSQSDESCFYVPSVDPSQAPLFRGQCEDITGVAGFDANRYLGWWHEIERFPSDDNVGECISSRYQSSGNTIQVVDTSIFDLTAETASGTVTISNNGRLRRVINNRVQDIWVLATDYDNYALLYSCENVDSEYRRVWSAKHSKTRSLSQAAQNVMAPVIQANRVLYQQFYQPVDQSDSACFHYPTQTGAEVILPGQCDTSIPVVGSFDVDTFQGTWYQIQRYDAVGASSCIGTRLSYDGTSGDIDILGYEVVGGELTTVEGTGRLASSDGSGRLTVVLPVPGSEETTERTFLILATDYEQYALVYSCVNVDPFHRQVGAWQLSRERSMPTAGVTAIASIINQREELHVPYFNLISHQEECPEPSSAFLFNSSIILVLVCSVIQLVW